MQEIIDRFDGQITGRVSRVRAEPRGDHLLVWLLKWGDESNDHPHVPVARIRQAGGLYKVTWLRGSHDRASEEAEYSDREKLFAAIDSAIGARDAEAVE